VWEDVEEDWGDWREEGDFQKEEGRNEGRRE
jgi:hypothetical protein